MEVDWRWRMNDLSKCKSMAMLLLLLLLPLLRLIAMEGVRNDGGGVDDTVLI